MKKVALAALLSSVVSGAALAADVPATANMVFEGSSSSTIPGSTLAITGIGGGQLLNGKLTVGDGGTFTTEKPVDFEIHNVDANGVIGDIVTSNQKLTYTAVNVVVNGASVSLDTKVMNPILNLSNGADLEKGKAADVKPTDALHIRNNTKMDDFKGGDVSATVAVMVAAASNPAPTL